MRKVLASVLLSMVLAAGSATAHHSYAMFDRTRTVIIRGTIQRFEWTNPHAWIFVVVAGESGASDTYGIECMSPTNLSRAGWSKRTFNPGDKIQVEFNPMKDGSKGGAFTKATLADGTVVVPSSF